MEKITIYENIIIELLQELATDSQVNGEELHDEILIDRQKRHYCLLWLGFEDKGGFVDKILVHFQLKDNGKIWILANWTENQLAILLMEKGVERQDIVLGFRPENVRAATKYAVK